MIVTARPASSALACLLVCGAVAACSAATAPSSGARATGGDGNNAAAGSLNVGNGGTAGSGLNVSNGGSNAMLSDCGDGPPTSLSGTVYDPAGAVPLYNIVVFVPGEALSPIASGATCQTCDGDFSGKPQAVALSDAAGNFKIDNVPAGDNIPLVIQVGKWRRQVTIPHVNACADNPIMDKDLTRLPRNQSEGNIPHMAISIGGSDSLECLIRRIGVDDAEFTPPSGTGRVHLYTYGETAAKTMMVGGASTPLPDSATLWGSVDSLMKYDLMLLSCTGASGDPDVDDPNAPNVRAYANQGGRIFGSHWHNHWIRTEAETATDPNWYPQVIKFPSGAHGIDVDLNAQIDTTFPKGQALSDWLVNVKGSTTPGQIVIKGAEHTMDSVLPMALMTPDPKTYAAGPGAQQWIYATDPMGSSSSPTTLQYFSMNTPVAGAECGRMVFSDLHVSTGSGDTTKVPFPTGCSTAPLTPQQLALEFMLFDLSSCVQSDMMPPEPPPVVK